MQWSVVITWYNRTPQQWPRQNIKQGLHSQKTPPTSFSQASYGVSFVSFLENCPCYYGTALYQGFQNNDRPTKVLTNWFESRSLVPRVSHVSYICYVSYSLSEKFNSLRLGDAIWWQRSGSTLAQVMAYCLMAPSHYLSQCWCVAFA